MKLKLRLMSTLFAASMLVCNAGALSCGETLPENGVTNAATECTVEGNREGQQKAADMQRLVHLLGLQDANEAVSIHNSVDTQSEIHDIISKYYDDSVVDQIVNSHSGMQTRASNKKVYNLNLSAVKQATNYWCGPASAYMVVANVICGTDASQAKMASLMETNANGTYLSNIPNGLNPYMPNTYEYYQTDGSNSTAEAIKMTNSAIGTLSSGYGVVYDTVQRARGSARLVGYYNLTRDVYHYIAGEGYDITDASNRKCYYVDPHNTRTEAYGHHTIAFRTLCTLMSDENGTSPLGLVF